MTHEISEFNAEERRERRHVQILDGQGHYFVQIQADANVENDEHVAGNKRQNGQKRTDSRRNGEQFGRCIFLQQKQEEFLRMFPEGG